MNYLWNIMKQSLEVLDMINGYGYELFMEYHETVIGSFGYDKWIWI